MPPTIMQESKQHFHFIGICGTAMGSVAAAMKQRGHVVTGSDANVYPPMSTFLLDQGVALSSGYAAENIPAATDQVIIGNAISRGNDEAEAVMDRKLLYVSLPEVLKMQFLRGKSNYVITGTHGKTTTTSMLAWLLLDAGKDPSFMIGGLAKNLGVGAKFTSSKFTVLEGDEYDTAFFDKRSKFMHYLPEVVVINNIEFDHADIYDSLHAIKLSFRRLLNVVPRNGVAFINGDCANTLDVASTSPAPVSRVGLSEDCDCRIQNIVYSSEGSAFTIEGERYLVPMDGEFNVRNAAMAVCAARHAGLSPDTIRVSLAKFRGIARRQEVRGEVRGVRVIDDFGHHPTAIGQALRAMKLRYPVGKVWAVFEPRSNTSQRNTLQNELVEALAEADGAIIPPISAPEKFRPEDRLDPEAVISAVCAKGTEGYYEHDVDAIIARLKPLVSRGDTIIVLSNGGFGGIHDRLLNEL
jgi:UDP-N-acetylmuramate: L-alanyl-gamma-D-glutamyl-meso-diaminopimelate ligase